MRKKIFFLVKILISFLFLTFFISKTDLSSYFIILKNTNFLLFLVAVFFYYSSLFVFSLRWSNLTSMFNIKITYYSLLKANLVSMFYSSFLPGGFLSGEAIKCYKISKNSNEKEKLVLSVFLDKIISAISFVILGFSIFIILKIPFYEVLHIYTFLFVCSLLFIFFITSAWAKVFLKSYLLNFSKKIKYFKFLEEKNLIKKKYVVFSLLNGFLFLLSITTGLYFIILSLGETIFFLDLIWINSLVSIMTMVPLTFLGIGFRDVSLIYLLGFYGMEVEKILVVSTLVIFTILLRGIPGLFIELKKLFS